MEVLSLVTSQETWLRQQAGETHAWLQPTWNGQLRIHKPPLTVWVHLLAWAGLGPEAPVSSLVLRARIVAIGMTALLLAAVFWIGWQSGGRALATGAVLATGTTLLFSKQARLAAYDIHLTAWSAISVASGMWCFKSAGGSRAVAWRALAAGLALAAAGLSKSPVALLFVALPLMAFALTSDSRPTALRRLALILLIGAVVALPWYVWVSSATSQASQALLKDFVAVRSRPKPIWYYVNSIGYVFPWVLVFPVSLLCRRTKAEPGGLRTNPHWWWFVLTLACLSIPGAKQPRYLLPLFPAIGLLTADVWLSSANPAGRRLGRMDGAHWLLLAVLSLAPAAAVALRGPLERMGVGDPALLRGLNPADAWIVTAALIALVAAGLRASRVQHRLAGLFCTALWASVLGSWAAGPYANSSYGRFEELDQCRAADAMIGRQPVAYLRTERSDLQPDAKFLLYTRRVVPAVAPDELASFASATGTVWVIARDDSKQHDILLAAGYDPLQSFADGSQTLKRLYRSSPGSGR
jgi:4-amino-4-deoxy-L-arabinose transferase-like glycosyltransferase